MRLSKANKIRGFVCAAVLAALVTPWAEATESQAGNGPTSAALEKGKPTDIPEPVAEPVVKDAPKNQDRSLKDIFSSWFSDEEDEVEPAAMDSHASTVLTAADLLSDEELKEARSWEPPNYTGQTGALGWNEFVFEIPAGLRSRVEFWRDIYTKYTANQGVLHDSVFIDIVYAPIDFGEIMRSSSLNIYQKSRAREKLVDTRRKEIVDRLRRLHGRTSPEGLSGEDLRLWRMFEPVKDPNKFLAAGDVKRVRFQLGQKDQFMLGIYHSGRYLKQMEKIFRDEGLPIELTRLPFVESSFNLRARSRVGASGIWQFMRRTARPYMKVSRDIDERNDPLKSTRASARLLKQNYSMLQSWPLAVTGYNHGAFGVKTIVNKTGTRDLSEIVRRYSSKTFGFASENFYACFLAALEAEKDALKNFGEPKWGPEIQSAEIRVAKAMPFKVILDLHDGNSDLAELSNPHLSNKIRSGKQAVPSGTFVRVPLARKKIAEDFVRGGMSLASLNTALRDTPVKANSVQPVFVPLAPVGKPAGQ